MYCETQGPSGPIGLPGMRGADGVVGDDGEAGDTGPAGPVGEPGEPGVEGLKGPAGHDGQPVNLTQSLTQVVNDPRCHTGNKWQSRTTWFTRIKRTHRQFQILSPHTFHVIAQF